MASLILLRGNSGSGKTSLAKLLQERFGPNTMRLSHDMIRMDMLHVRGREGAEKSLPQLRERGAEELCGLRFVLRETEA